MTKLEYISKYGENAYNEYLRKKREYNDAHKQEIAERNRQWRESNPDYQKHYQNETKFGRASMLISSYRKADKKQNRGDCTLTHQWFIDNIFGSSCFYCGCSDWHALGADRIDNSLPHTPDNVVPCCCNCNKERQKMNFKLFVEKKKKLVNY